MTIDQIWSIVNPNLVNGLLSRVKKLTKKEACKNTDLFQNSN